MSSSTTRLYRGLVPRLVYDNVLPHTRQGGDTMSSASVGHIILTPAQPVGSGRPLSGDGIQDLLTRSRMLYRLRFLIPLEREGESV